MFTLIVRGRPPHGVTAKELQRIASATFVYAGGKGNAEMSLSVVADAVIRKLNRQYRGKDATTDVLSFGYEDAREFVRPKKDTVRILGDVFVSLPQVRRQAKQIGRSVSQEFALMVVHGTLHLMGYDHATLRDERRMFGLQHEILIRTGIL